MNNDLSSIRQREKFKALLRDRGISLRRMSLDLGMNESYFQQFVTYGRPPFIDGAVLRQAAIYLDVPESELAAPPTKLQDSLAPAGYDLTGYRSSLQRPGTENDVVVLPYYDLSASYTGEDWRAEENQAGHMAFSRQMLQGITSAPGGQLALLRVSGDAMTPTLTQGDYVLLDCGHRIASEDGIYVIAHESRLLIKRVSVDPIRRQVTLSCDNASYAASREYSLVDIRVAGRIIWVGKNL